VSEQFLPNIIKIWQSLFKLQ